MQINCSCGLQEAQRLFVIGLYSVIRYKSVDIGQGVNSKAKQFDGVKLSPRSEPTKQSSSKIVESSLIIKRHDPLKREIRPATSSSTNRWLQSIAHDVEVHSRSPHAKYVDLNSPWLFSQTQAPAPAPILMFRDPTIYSSPISMSEDLTNEIEAINSIYGYQTLRQANNYAYSDGYILSIPQHEVSLRLSIPAQYPAVPIQILGTETTGDTSRKGYGNHVLSLTKQTLQTVFTPGSVCLFDLLQELETALAVEEETSPENNDPTSTDAAPYEAGTLPEPTAHSRQILSIVEDPPNWTFSAPLTEKRSLFLARACAVHTPAQARVAIADLLATDKRAAKATHNVFAYRIRAAPSTSNPHNVEIIYQDHDDDGENAAGSRLLHLLQVMDVWDVLVVVSRWYGGVKLGPDRLRIINSVAREAIVAGGWAAEGKVGRKQGERGPC